MNSEDIRKKFLSFFKQDDHKVVKSASLVPAGDPTLLFTNAGMVPFKDYFLGIKKPSHPRATSSQKCVRAGGKHNDLENVGFTARHHTFFEMLGNFSFGDYFKEKAIVLAWELMTKQFAIPQDKLRITIYKDDDEAFALWKKIGVREDWIYRLGEKDNFWAMGDTGPCGPCTEIHYDWGDQFGCKKPNCTPACECGARFLEIWNLVFMQFNRDSSGKMDPLPKPSVDTGAGLERWASVLQGKYNNYDTDVFSETIEAIAYFTKRPYGEVEEATVSMRVIADHIRAACFLMADGVNPSNEGRGYVLRRILRRAIRHGKKLGMEEPFLYKLVPAVRTKLGNQYPELRKQQSLIEQYLKEEESKFHETLHRGTQLLEDSIEKEKSKSSTVLPGNIAFKLYDTFGFPVDLTSVICQEQGMTIDEDEFSKLMEKQRSQSTWEQGDNEKLLENLSKVANSQTLDTQFIGYKHLREDAATVLFLCQPDGTPAESLETGKQGLAVFDKTPFYAESGGQVGDLGSFQVGTTLAEITDTIKAANLHLHRVEVKQNALKVGDTGLLQVDTSARKLTAINHTATHLLHAALRNELGDRVKQAGSLVEPSRLRFDFTFPRGLTHEEIENIEDSVAEQIHHDKSVTVNEMSYQKAIDSGALAFFDEKYGENVRVVRVGEGDERFSVELCGGTHLKQTSEIGVLKIINESSVASGVRRIEALTSGAAERYLRGRSNVVDALGRKLNVPAHQLVKKIDSLLTENKKQQREIETLQVKAAASTQSSEGNALWEKQTTINGISLVTEVVPNVNAKVLGTLVDQVRDKLQKKAIVLLASHNKEKAFICLGISKDLLGTYDAAKLVRIAAEEIGGKGGGRQDFAQAGGNNPQGVQSALSKFQNWVRANV